MTKKEVMKKAARNREIQARMREIYTKMEKERREEYNEEEKREMAELTSELEDNRREILLRSQPPTVHLSPSQVPSTSTSRTSSTPR